MSAGCEFCSNSAGINMKTRENLTILIATLLGALSAEPPHAGAQALIPDYVAIDLGTLGGDFSRAYGINNSGHVIGRAYANNNVAQHAFLYSNDSMQDLGTLSGGIYSYAYGINDSGEVVGVTNDSNTLNHAFVYLNG